MKNSVALFLALLMLCAACTASACGTFVLIPDSDTRLLTEAEVSGYCYDTLGYVEGEILARHGWHFDPESRYIDHFENINYLEPHDSGFPYREAPADVTNEAILAGLSDIERQNLELVQRVIAEKIQYNDRSGFYESWCCEESTEWYNRFCDHEGVDYLNLPRNLSIPVYSGPGRHYLRAEGGAAALNSNQEIFAYGFDGEWLLVVYQADPLSWQNRYGYIHRDDHGRDLLPAICRPGERDEDDNAFCSDHAVLLGQLDFTAEPLTLPVNVTLTDDPVNSEAPLARLDAGETVTVLYTFPPERTREDFESDRDYEDYLFLCDEVYCEGPLYYVETTGEMPVRGFIPSGALNPSRDEDY